MATTPDSPAANPLTAHVTTDACVVGAGIAGLTTAYLLAREGRKVVVLDDGPVGGGETGRTTAHLVCALDDRYFELERLHGFEGARMAYQSHAAATDKVEQIVRETGADCAFHRVDGYLFVPPGEAGDVLEREYDAARRAGLELNWADRAPIRDFDTGRALRFPNQAQFHPLNYLLAVAGTIRAAGGMIFTGAHAQKIVGGKDAHVTTAGGSTVRCGAVVVATNTPVNDLVAIHTKQGPYRTYVIGARVPKGAVPRVLLWDTPDPYHYVRIEELPDHDVLIVGGEDHKTGQADDQEERFARLFDWARVRWPMIQSVDYRWSGQVMEPVDSLAFIGRNPLDHHNVYIATGDSGNGMTHGTIAGMLISDLIAGRENPWSTLYDPSRKSLRAAGTFAHENANVAAQYADWLAKGDVRSVEEIPPDSGAVVRRGIHLVACYRDAGGQVHECSAMCTHLAGVVHWNKLEKTWDCPCHGSRFSPTGEVINGPALSPLHAAAPAS
jgi:glycine/D-amino acid oxidase-like deaminating enzyme/nitrite reductase/ring-hydroxylating ferredoxin subunit